MVGTLVSNNNVPTTRIMIVVDQKNLLQLLSSPCVPCIYVRMVSRLIHAVRNKQDRLLMFHIATVGRVVLATKLNDTDHKIV